MITQNTIIGTSFKGSVTEVQKACREITDAIFNTAPPARRGRRELVATSSHYASSNDLSALEVMFIISVSSEDPRFIQGSEDARLWFTELTKRTIARVFPELRFSVLLSFNLKAEYTETRPVSASFTERDQDRLDDIVATLLRARPVSSH